MPLQVMRKERVEEKHIEKRAAQLAKESSKVCHYAPCS
jgi:hypothetical protein